ncbi:hypothetical protein Ppa06_69970 [Planomonospora parontospora subsp. parontospora]|uniref:Uncharacterized protein n=2 Tax=Planomonospora parontospora TaxID=58119 RepID=A0AA37BNK9_9ACTN|nr:hypothetical protein GCM10010126_61810 [Planomonospora parontospora]GII13199.1 hypothetical protein Ppa06_69970 [Planomonospora parontospora subsp. parontospora]
MQVRVAGLSGGGRISRVGGGGLGCGVHGRVGLTARVHPGCARGAARCPTPTNPYSNVKVGLQAPGRSLLVCPPAAHGCGPARARCTGAPCGALDAKDTGPRMPAPPAASCPP